MSLIDSSLDFSDPIFNVELTGNLVVQEGIINPMAGDVRVDPIPGLNASNVQDALVQLNDLPDLVLLFENGLI
jgi:hypothetical protein